MKRIDSMIIREEQTLNELELLLNVVKENDDIKYFEPILFINPMTIKCNLPKFDKLYYEYLDKSLLHLLYKYEKGWINSERQVIYSSNECISTVHFVFEDNNKIMINVFQRSSNLKNLHEDIMFFNYFINKYLVEKYDDVNINYFISSPHYFKNKKTKIDE